MSDYCTLQTPRALIVLDEDDDEEFVVDGDNVDKDDNKPLISKSHVSSHYFLRSLSKGDLPVNLRLFSC